MIALASGEGAHTPGQMTYDPIFCVYILVVPGPAQNNDDLFACPSTKLWCPLGEEKNPESAPESKSIWEHPRGGGGACLIGACIMIIRANHFLKSTLKRG